MGNGYVLAKRGPGIHLPSAAKYQIGYQLGEVMRADERTSGWTASCELPG